MHFPTPGTIRVLVADDHVGLAASLTSTLSQWYRTECAANSLDQLRDALARRVAPADETALVVLQDLAFGPMNALRALPELTERHPEVRFVVHTAHASEVLVDAALHSGAVGYVDKGCGLTELRRAIERAVQGRPAVFLAGDSAHDGRRVGRSPSTPLTPALRRVLNLLKQGVTRQGIAARLRISESGVDAAIGRLRRCYGVGSRERVDWRGFRPD